MTDYKEKFEKMRIAGKLASQTLDMLTNNIKEGVSTNHIDKLGYEFIRDNGGYSAPLYYRGFKKSLCTSLNHVVCHGIPSEDRILEEGDADEWCDIALENIYKTEKWDNQAPTALLIGRYQPFHVGHKTLVKEAIERTGQCCIALRDVAGIDDSNPYDFEKVKEEIHAACVEFGDKIKVVELPNITDVFYGRGVGYTFTEHDLGEEIHKISATKIRKKMRDQDKL